MVWGKKNKEVEEASEAIASIFSPNYTGLKERPAKEESEENVALKEIPDRSLDTIKKEVDQRWTGLVNRWKKFTGGEDRKRAEEMVKEMPPCPLKGYELTRKGVVDSLTAEKPHLLSPPELRALLVQLSGIEATAKYAVDEQFLDQMNARGTRAAEHIINPILFVIGLYLMTYKTVSLYQSAIPRESVFLNKRMDLFAWRNPVSQRELLARRHRRFMQATNAKVILTFLTGSFLVGFSAFTRPAPDVVDNAPEVNVAKDVIAYHQLSEEGLKWLMKVYYNHPTYATYASEKAVLTIQ